MRAVLIVLIAMLVAAPVAAQVAPPPAKGDREPVQHGAQPNPEELRPGNRDGDASSAATGDLVEKPGRRIFGLPVNAALVIGGLLVALLVVAGVAIPAAARRRRAQGGGTFGSSPRHSSR
jgi:hypothetical protein